MSIVTIVLADDHEVVRVGLRALLEAQPGFTVVGEASDGVEAVQLVERLHPDVLVLDLMMPSLNGLDVSRRIAQCAPETRVVILSMYDSEAYVVQALQSGAAAYVLKQSSATALVAAVHEVMAGRRYLSPLLSQSAIEAYIRYKQEARSEALDPYETLTPREREVLYLAATGCTNAQIAKRLYISVRTVETHRGNLMRKLGLRTRVDLIRYALQRGILLK